MASTQETKTAKNGNAKSTPEASSAPSRFTKVGKDRYMFNPNQGCTGSLVGYLLGVEHMAPIRDKDWDCFIVRTTQPCKALNRDREVVDVPAGEDVLIPANFKLADTFNKAAVNPTHCVEVCITPGGKVDIGGGQTMRVYDMGVDMSTAKPRSAFGIAAMLPSPSVPKALPQGSDESELPF